MDLIPSPMNLDDLDRVLDIERLSFSLPWSRHAFVDELLMNDQAVYMVVRDSDGVAMGYGGMWLILDEAHITNVAVHPEYRRRGVGRAIMVALMETAVLRGARRMTLETRLSNVPAQELYRSLGFVAAGVRPRYYLDDHEDALVMWLEDLPGRLAMMDGEGGAPEDA
ncbi:MAG: ribosomal protein S18-alanine N-acetyltransferase [Bacillota bacterium]|jgi:ribosomal-protein-alanine N-acetyltransferase|nr:ribosomal protein S18-alanine N-acetyltransferase [Bacillota bacterium]HOB41627.1 ribosomal protein S18-alanine N-acetyltransferase [Bacillota bacterium]HOK71890.1 ribosomal protein S18-alanine N-acetyltransferase [Bacillota bacterium]HOL52300.1 ribosomal protein S18-alanine N-acetyltransferase [Bacillota bacterium]HOO29414.1 ribosomal protein S18-alanine N-acetyltransferase [Bacillota bacterium]